MIKAYLAFVFVEVVVSGGEALHGDEEVPEGGFELGPVEAVVEQVEHEGFDLHSIQIREQNIDDLYQQLHNILLVAVHLVRLAGRCVDGGLD